jgi:aspartate/methionine/tyrosine aminotransferase
VVITNGAKQGIAATLYALKKMGHKGIAIHKPYWVSTPTLIGDSGLYIEYAGDDCKSSAFMLTSPNNPDGKELTKEQIVDLDNSAKQSNLALIHDAAYYTPIYMQNPADCIRFGDVQIYSAAKMYGVSGLRVGYVVCHNPAYEAYVQEYVERTTSGVSVLSQKAVLQIEEHFKDSPASRGAFEQEARAAISAARQELMAIHGDVLVLPDNASTATSMFLWAKPGPKLNGPAAKVHFLNGSIFGDASMVRINVAVPAEVMREAVRRLNQV